MFELDGKVCVVTGGSRGLGREMALAFARAGATVVVASRKIEACEAVVAEITETTGAQAAAVRCHVGVWNECAELLDATEQLYGRVDVLVNNAGMSPPYDSLSGVTEALFDKVVDVNLKGPFRLSALAAERMAAAAGGSIINISSIASVEPSAGEIPYALAKAGLNALTVAIAHAFGPSVRANGIMAGPFLTDISAAWDPDEIAEFLRTRVPLGRAGRPDEIVGAALYLASDASSYTSGSVLKVDGGKAWTPA